MKIKKEDILVIIRDCPMGDFKLSAPNYRTTYLPWLGRRTAIGFWVESKAMSWRVFK